MRSAVNAFITASITGFAALPSCWALASPAEQGEQVRQLAEQYQESKRNLVDSEAQKRQILGSLYSITKRMKKITQEKGHLTDELFQVQGSVQGIARVIAQMETQIVEQRKRLRTRLRALYKLSGESFAGVLFSQTSSREVDQALKYLKIITDADYRLIRGYQKNIEQYKKQRRKLKVQVERLVTLERRIKSQEVLLVQEHHAKTRIVSALEASRKAAMKQIRHIRDQTESAIGNNEDAGTDGVSNLLKASFFEQKGRIPAPVNGTVVRDFGFVHNPRFDIQLSHKGWQYRATAGTPVISVFDGVVVHSGWINGYGHAVIIDHGDHYYTIYSQVMKVKVDVGDNVNKGQTIAEAGSTSRQFGDGLYFEIRHFSEPENPKHWLEHRSNPMAIRKDNEPVEVATAGLLSAE